MLCLFRIAYLLYNLSRFFLHILMEAAHGPFWPKVWRSPPAHMTGGVWREELRAAKITFESVCQSLTLLSSHSHGSCTRAFLAKSVALTQLILTQFFLLERHAAQEDMPNSLRYFCVVPATSFLKQPGESSCSIKNQLLSISWKGMEELD